MSSRLVTPSPRAFRVHGRSLRALGGVIAPLGLVGWLGLLPAVQIGEVTLAFSAVGRLSLIAIGLAVATSGWLGAPPVHGLLIVGLAGLALAARDPLVAGLCVSLLGLVAGLVLLESREAGRWLEVVGRYLTATVLGSGALTAGLVLLDSYRLTPDDILIGRLAAMLIAIGFALRLGAAPLHLWLPGIVERFPARGAILAVAVVNVSLTMVGVQALQRLPPGYLPPTGLHFLLSALLVGALLASAVALTAATPLRLAAYALVADADLILFGLGTGRVDGVAGAMLLALVQAPAVAVLALSLGRNGEAGEPAASARTAGRGWSGLVLGLAGLVLAGAPPTVGFSAWWLLAQAARPESTWLFLLTATSALLTLGAVRQGWRMAQASTVASKPGTDWHLVGAWLIGLPLLLGGLAPTWLVDLLLSAASAISGPGS